jgi:uncharacterized protein (TIGR02996 family)
MKRTFSPQELALLAAIHADPRSDIPRLVYADWLDENGQIEYAEFIRLQLQHGLWSPTLCQVTQRESDLKLNFRWEWAKTHRYGLQPFDYCRGLPIPPLYLNRCSTARATTLLQKMNARFRLILVLEQRELLLPTEKEDILEHPLMKRVAVLQVVPNGQGDFDDFLRRLNRLALPVLAERLSILAPRGTRQPLAESLFGGRYTIEL